MSKSLKILLSPLFLLSLLVLLANDFYLKSAFHNVATGKLSDFAGLFAFALFWMAFYPQRKGLICSLIAVFFVFWKSPLADGLIGAWNSLGLFGIGRTIDYTDLVALAVLPAAAVYAGQSQPIALPEFSFKYARAAIALVSVFAFTATSQVSPNEQWEEFGEVYAVERPAVEILKRLQDFETESFYQSRQGSGSNTVLSVTLREKVCDGQPSATFDLTGDERKSQIKLKSVSFRCEQKSPEARAKLKAAFENEVIGFLKQ